MQLHTGQTVACTVADPRACRVCLDEGGPPAIDAPTRSVASLAIKAARGAGRKTLQQLTRDVRRVETDDAPAKLPGVGDELARLVERFQLTGKSNCGCEARKRRMNAGGPDWCRQHADELVAEMLDAYDGEWPSLATLTRLAGPALVGMLTRLESPTRAAARWMLLQSIRAVEQRSVVAIVPLFNPAGYSRREANYRQAWEHYQTLGFSRVLTVEAVMPGQRSIALGDAIVLQAGDANVLWQKERLINIGIDTLRADPPTAVAWLDADLEWEEPLLVSQILRGFARWDVVQLFEQVELLDKSGKTLDARAAFAAPKSAAKIHAPGFAWAARWDVVAGGLWDAAVVGAGDVFLLNGWGRGKHRQEAMSPGMLRAWQQWKPQHKPSVGFLKGIVVRHHWHGRFRDRGYESRHQILRRHQFDPETDLRLSGNGLWEWSGAKPQLAADVRAYFASRQEDGVPADLSAAVVVTCHNYGEFLDDCLQSIAAQTHPASEVVVVLDACSDNSHEVAARWRPRGVRLEHAECRHPYLARRIGLSVVTADVVCFLDADDAISPDHLARAVEAFAADDRLGIVTPWAQTIGAIDGRWRPDVAADIESTNCCTSASVARTAALRETNAFEQFEGVAAQGEDWFVWRHLVRAGWRIAASDAVHYYRRHDRNISLHYDAPWAASIRQRQGWRPPPKVRVGWITPTLNTGGVIRNTRQKMQWARRLEWVRAVLLDGGPSDDHGARLIEEHCPIVAGRLHARANAAIKDRRRSIEEEMLQLARECDVLYVWGSIGAEMLRRLSEHTRILLGLHGQGAWTRRVARDGAPYASAIYAVCRQAVALTPATHRRKCVVIPNAVDLADMAPTPGIDVRAELGLAPGQIAVGWVGRISPEKDPRLFVDAMERLDRSRFVPVMVTPQHDPSTAAWSPELREEILGRVERIDGRILFGRQMGDVYQALDVLAMTSEEEGGPLVAAEAWAAGVPLVATRVGMIPWLEQQHGPLSLPILARDPREVAERIQEAALLQSGSPIIATAREVAWRRLNVTRMAGEFEDLVCAVAEMTATRAA